MSLSMTYGLLLGGSLAGAAYFLDRGMKSLGGPTRWIWILAMFGVALAPLLPLLPHGTPDPGPGGVGIPVELLYQRLGVGAHSAGPATNPVPSLDGVLVVLWCVSSALLFLFLGWLSLRLRREVRSWTRKTMNDEGVLVSRGLGPAVLGVLRPTIVLPPWALELDRPRLNLILLHEKEHRDARDPALLVLGILLLGLSPWNPGLWWMFRRLHLAVETDCDRRVLSRGVPPRAYGALLLDVASETRRHSSLVPALAGGGRTLLERRLSMIRNNVGKTRTGSAVLALGAALGFIALACETPTPPSSMELQVDFQASDLPVEVAGQDDGYYVFKKEGGQLHYVKPLAEDDVNGGLKTGGTATFQAVEVTQLEEKTPPAGAVVRLKEMSPEAMSGLLETRESGFTVVRLREAEEPSEVTLDPLIIVDGVITSLIPGEISDLDPENIESIEVIKGKAAEALYGERARGGVIHITTKR